MVRKGSNQMHGMLCILFPISPGQKYALPWHNKHLSIDLNHPSTTDQCEWGEAKRKLEIKRGASFSGFVAGGQGATAPL